MLFIKFSNQIILLFTFLISSSCVTVQRGEIIGNNIVSSGSNVEMVDNVSSYSKRINFLYITANNVNMILEAKHKLYANYDLKTGESFENFVVVERKTFFPYFFSKSEVIINADIVKRDTLFKNMKSDKYNDNLSHFKVDTSSIFQLNDDVVFLRPNTYFKINNGKIIDVLENKVVIIDERYNIFNIKKHKVFVLKNYKNLKVGLSIEFEIFNEKGSGEIIGINKDYVFVKIDGNKDRTELIPIKSIKLNN